MENTYFYALGRRKTAVATVRLFADKGESTINGKPFSAYVVNSFEREQLLSPLKVAGFNPEEFYFTAKIVGSGPKSQLGALKLALARAIVIMDPSLKKTLKNEDLLTRDPRMVERKKPGLRKARRAEQYSRR